MYGVVPVPIGGSMDTASYVLAGCEESMQRALGSACHGAGRARRPPAFSSGGTSPQLEIMLKETAVSMLDVEKILYTNFS